MTATRHLLLLLALGWSGQAAAQDLRDFCPDRPGLGTPACTIDKGHAAVELGLGDWTLDRQDGERTDTVIAGDLLVRYGLADRLELQIGWQAFGWERQRDATGSVERRTGTGDVRLALRRNLSNPDGSGFAAAVMPYVTLPTGRAPIGEGDWTAGMLVPLSYEIGKDMHVAFTGEIDAAADEQGDGHHLAYSGVLGLDLPLSEDVSFTAEIAAERDEEEGQRSTELRSGLSLAWQPNEALQFDAGANFGLNRDAPDLQLYLGIAKRF